MRSIPCASCTRDRCIICCYDCFFLLCQNKCLMPIKYCHTNTSILTSIIMGSINKSIGVILNWDSALRWVTLRLILNCVMLCFSSSKFNIAPYLEKKSSWKINNQTNFYSEISSIQPKMNMYLNIYKYSWYLRYVVEGLRLMSPVFEFNFRCGWLLLQP